MPTITEFLEARIAEDEQQAGICRELGWSPAKKYGVTAVSPARVLAECAAKRAIIAAHKNQEDNDDDSAWIVASEVLLRALAAVYASHPDYRQEWAL